MPRSLLVLLLLFLPFCSTLSAGGQEPTKLQLWKVKSPGAAETIVHWQRPHGRVWDAAGNLHSHGNLPADGEEILNSNALGGLIEGEVSAGDDTSHVDGDSLWVELPRGITADAAIQRVEAVAHGKAFYGQLASHWAPHWYQDEDDSCAWADLFTAVDFDGNWDPTDNWENSARIEHRFKGSFLNEAVVYWWVLETRTHYFLGFADYHPRDWEDSDSLVSKVQTVGHWLQGTSGEHENDMEGCLLTIRKVPGQVWGELELMQSQAHNDFWQYAPSDMTLGERQTAGKRREDIDEEVTMTLGRPTLWIESKGHGVYGHKGKTDYSGSSSKEDGRVYRPLFGAKRRGFCAWPVSAEKTPQLMPTRDADPEVFGDAWADADGKGRKAVDYALVSMRNLWRFYRRPERVPGEVELFVTKGDRCAFKGDTKTVNAANPPWGWTDGDYEGLGLPKGGVGMFFERPWEFVSWQFDFDGRGRVSDECLGHSFDLDEESPEQ